MRAQLHFFRAGPPKFGGNQWTSTGCTRGAKKRKWQKTMPTFWRFFNARPCLGATADFQAEFPAQFVQRARTSLLQVPPDPWCGMACSLWTPSHSVCSGVLLIPCTLHFTSPPHYRRMRWSCSKKSFNLDCPKMIHIGAEIFPAENIGLVIRNNGLQEI